MLFVHTSLLLWFIRGIGKTNFIDYIIVLFIDYIIVDKNVLVYALLFSITFSAYEV